MLAQSVLRPLTRVQEVTIHARPLVELEHGVPVSTSTGTAFTFEFTSGPRRATPTPQTTGVPSSALHEPLLALDGAEIARTCAPASPTR